MKNISIQLEKQVADIYQSSNTEEKKKINVLINLWLKNFLARDKKKRLFETIDEISKQARSRGLTENKLAKILNEK